MDIKVDIRGNSKVAIVTDTDIILANVQDALDLLATVNYQYGCEKIMIEKSAIVDNFFDLKTKLAGDILQKYTTYGMKLAIVGDFSTVTKKSLKDFIYESNQGNQIFFLESEGEALYKLHRK